MGDKYKPVWSNDYEVKLCLKKVSPQPRKIIGWLETSPFLLAQPDSQGYCQPMYVVLSSCILPARMSVTCNMAFSALASLRWNSNQKETCQVQTEWLLKKSSSVPHDILANSSNWWTSSQIFKLKKKYFPEFMIKRESSTDWKLASFVVLCILFIFLNSINCERKGKK